MVDYEKIVESEKKDRMEKILSVFPGYGGYRKKEILRETDRLVRDTLFNDLRKSKEQLQRYCRDFVSNGKINANDSERILMKIDSITEKIHHATYGYASEMSVIKIKEDRIRKLIEFDETLANDVKKIRESIDKLKNSPDDTRKLLSDVNEAILSLEENFSNRKEYMMNLGAV